MIGQDTLADMLDHTERVYGQKEWSNMGKRAWIFIGAAGVAVVVGIIAGRLALQSRKGIPQAAMNVFEKSEHFELLTLKPGSELNDEERKHGEIISFHMLLGKAEVTDERMRKALVAAFDHSVAIAQKNEREGETSEMTCFNPRHALRATWGDVTVTAIICFECRHYEMTIGSERTSGDLADGDGKIFEEAAAKLHLPTDGK